MTTACQGNNDSRVAATAASSARIVHLSDEPPIPSFFIRFCDPIRTLTDNWCYVRADDCDACEITETADLVFVQRAYSVRAQLLVERAKANGTPVIYETDDYLLQLPAQSRLILSEQGRAAIRSMLTAADVVTCSTHRLAESLGVFNNAVKVLENYGAPCHPDRIAESRAHSAQPHAVLVNTDYFKLSAGKQQLFLSLEEAIRTLQYRITFVGSTDPRMEDLQKRYPDRVAVRPWFVPRRNLFLEMLLDESVNVAIVPLEANDDHSYKSDIKFFDFGSIGVPGIYDNPGVYTRVAHLDNGFLCRSGTRGWSEGLEYFASEQNRARCGDRAYECSKGRTLRDYVREFSTVIADVLVGRSSVRAQQSRAGAN
jgi:hypothetical protein